MRPWSQPVPPCIAPIWKASKADTFWTPGRSCRAPTRGAAWSSPTGAATGSGWAWPKGSPATAATTGHIAGESIPRYTRDAWLGELHKLGVEMIPLVRLFGLDGDTAFFQHMASGEPVICEEVDTLIVSQGHEPVVTLERELQEMAVECRIIGDCLAPRTAEEAVLEGLEAATAL